MPASFFVLKKASGVANGYEKKTGRQRGSGSNVLLISDFESGKAEEILSTHSSKITGLHPMGRYVLVSVWRSAPNLRIYDRKNPENAVTLENPPQKLGIPYSTYKDPVSGNILQTYFGSLKKKGEKNRGGLLSLIEQ